MVPKLYLKTESSDEVDVSKAIKGLIYLGDDESPTIASTYQQNVSKDGQILQSLSYDKNVINAKFGLRFGNWYDFKLAKHEIYKLFSQREVMRIMTDAEPAIVKYVVPATFDVTPIEEGSNTAVFTIPFENPSGYKYSLLRSDSLYTFDEDGWQFGMNLPSEDLVYTHSEPTFKIYNASDIKIDPYYQNHDLVIKLNFEGQSITITNKTTNTSWSYNKPAKKADNIVLNQLSTTLNGEPASVNTDYGNLTLATGWNDISVTGATDFTVTFSFPFIYLG
ncbi:phage tail family protein [Pediococcus acidilactici]|nr:phage tail family protein [Pediococcus acidilactici]KAF0383658.1 phage tail family protein [Pediococcus acidilactici]KAF0457644.1 phage tail family protein [Pediococcus acidilactici]KAF0476922.1 phage tail family protein [Pediococcus acidilactici]KAF0537448.1 phage tail family protein [Pediococcus acidilactici]